MNIQTLQEIAERTYKSRNLHEGYPSASTDIQQNGECIILTFNTNKAYYIESLLFPKNKALIIKNITSYPFEKKELGEI